MTVAARRSLMAGLALACLAVGGCSAEGPAPIVSGGSDDCSAFEQYGDLRGTTIEVFSSIVAPDDQAHRDSYKPFEQCTGARVAYEGSRQFEAAIRQRTSDGDPPDIAYFPQPGLLAALVDGGAVVPAGAQTVRNVDEYWDPVWRQYGTVDGTLYAAPLGANVKSLVWYSPGIFEANGWEVPTTWDQLRALTARIAASGAADKPWCVGIASGEATGWPLTDWLEDVVLRREGTGVYDDWVSHTIPFDDERIVAALDEVGWFTRDPAHVNGGLGGVDSVATTTVEEAGIPVLSGRCAMHRQASGYGAELGAARATIAPDGDVWAFYLPSMDDSRPTLVGGEFVAAFSARPEVEAFQAYLSSPQWVNAKARVSTGWVSANRGADATLFGGIGRASVEILQDPGTQVRFDGSDLMPEAVGAGTFWEQMTSWQRGAGTRQALAAVEASWPVALP